MIVNRTQRIVEFVSFLLLWVSAAMFTRAYRREFNVIEQRLEIQQREIERLTDALGKTVNNLDELAKKGHTK